MITFKKRFAVLLTSVILAANVNAAAVHAADAGNITFPDANLKKALIANGVDLNKDGQISREEMASRADIGGMGNGLSHLDLRGYGITNLSGIEHAVHIKSISLNQNPLSDIGPLKSLTSLDSLMLTQTQVTDLSPLAGMENIRMLGIADSKVRNLGPVATLTGLSMLDITHNQITDISPLASLSDLTVFYGALNQIRDISALSSLKYLRHVDLSVNQIKDISPLSASVSLERLLANYNQISDISGLAPLKALKSLYLSNNQISDLSPLSDKKDLQILDAAANRIINLSSLSQLKSLKLLDLSFNQIQDLGPLQGLNHLKLLGLGSNDIEKVDALSGLHALTQLILADNQITDISPLSSLTQLDTLLLSNNRISNVEALARMTGMKELHLENNSISNIAALSNMTKLSGLIIRGNPIKDLSPLQSLTGLQNLIVELELRKQLKLPVEGIVSGGSYQNPVTITFQEGSGKLNGKSVPSGIVVSEEGNHTFNLSGVGGATTQVYFAIDRTAPIVTGVADGGLYHEAVTILFNEGEAFVNGQSAATDYWYDQSERTDNYRVRIKEQGVHSLLVRDAAGNETAMQFTIQPRATVIHGVSNQSVYNTERTITFNDATALLNGEPFKSGQKVSQAGKYQLEVRGDNGTVTSVKFTITAEGANTGASLAGVSAWAAVDISYAQFIGLTHPVAQLHFGTIITREKFSEVAVKLYEAITGTTTSVTVSNPFKDTANAEIIKAYQLGIVTGTSKDRFSPNSLITREQLAAMLMRVIKLANVDIPAGTSKMFQDRSQFSPYAVEAIGYLSSIDVVKGLDDKHFGPRKNASIEQAVVMAKRIYELAQQGAKKGDSDSTETNDGLFGRGDMFAAYVKKPAANAISAEYALTNERGFTLPAYSAIYVHSMINQTPDENSTFGTLVIANNTDKPKQIPARSVDLSLDDIYRDKWGEMISPDGTTVAMKSTGPFIRLVVFDGTFDPQKPYSEYVASNNVIDLGSWNMVRHTKS
ncbi:leucine-rich repeat domain-containing protein [Paenibacillus sp. GXUN7292]|uniref:leucine-rich repeat domain-containing protein n=1 Tax=Paenibacillus sp. GXUN7292 TaxID=3422499 RepID=UPI003D7D507F